MDISVFGLGYVGTAMSGNLAVAGHRVTGVDIDPVKIELIKSSRSPIKEAGMDDLIADAVESGNFTATFDARAAVLDSDLSIICVGTPVDEKGQIDTNVLTRVCTKLGQVLANKDGFHTFVVRSTVPPGTTEELVVPTIEEAAGKKVFLDFDVCYNPHFLRVGSLIEDYRNPAFTIIGQQDDRAGDKVARIYDSINAPVIRTSIRVAELAKLACDAFHATKICFANEIGAACKSMGVDAHEVMNLIRSDEKLNLSGAYLDPGFAFGGPFISRSLRALIEASGPNSDGLPILSASLISNDSLIDSAVRLIQSKRSEKIGVVGLACKPGSDEVRESQMVKLVSRLLDAGLEVMVFDEGVTVANLIGENKTYLESSIPGIGNLIAGSFDQIYNWSDTLVIGHRLESMEYLATLDTDKIIIDLVRISEDITDSGENYEGLCW